MYNVIKIYYLSTCHLSIYLSVYLSSIIYLSILWASQVGLVVTTLPANAGNTRDLGWIPGSGRSPGVGNSSPLWYSCLENPMERGAWWATDHGVGHKELDMSEHTCTHICHLLSILYHLCIIHHLSIHLCISLLSSLSLC